MSRGWLTRSGLYRLRDRRGDEDAMQGRDLCVHCREIIAKGAGSCADCRRRFGPREDGVGKLHASIDHPTGTCGDLAVTCHTPEAQEAYGVDGPGPWAIERAVAWSVSDRLRASYGDGAVFS